MHRSMAVAALVIMSASAAGAQGADWNQRARFRDRDHRGAHLRIGGSYTLREGETASGPIVVIGGTAGIDGHVDDNVVVIGGTVRIGPTAVVDGDVVTFGGTSTIDPAARVLGHVSRARIHWPDVTRPALVWPHVLSDGWWSTGLAAAAAAFRLVFTLFVGLLFTLVAPGWIGGMGRRVSEATGVCAIVGFGVEIVMGPALIVIAIALAISIVGIPLLLGVPFLMLALAGLALAGFTAAATRVGAAIRGRDEAWLPARAGDFLIGFFALTAMTIVGRGLTLMGPGWAGSVAALVTSAGLFIEYCAWTIGLGAAVGALLDRRGAVPVAPPVPPLPDAAS